VPLPTGILPFPTQTGNRFSIEIRPPAGAALVRVAKHASQPLGITLKQNPGSMMVVVCELKPERAAEYHRAGLRVGDVLIAVNSVLCCSFAKAIKMLSAAQGTIELRVLHAAASARAPMPNASDV